MFDPLTDQPTIAIVTLAAAQTTVPFTCMIFDLDDLIVTRNGVVSTRVSSPLTPAQHKVTAVLGVEGGTIQFGGPAVGGEQVIIQRKVDVNRPANLAEAGPLGIKAINEELTRITAAQQDLRDRLGYLINQSLRAPLGETVAEMGALANRKGKVLGFDETTGAIALYAQDDFMGPPSTATIDAYSFLKTHAIAGTNVALAFNDGLATITFNVTAGAVYTTENAQDDVAAMVAVTAPVTKNYNDAGNTLTLALDMNDATFIERIQDIIGALLTATSPLTVTYNDAGNVQTITIDQTLVKPFEYLVVPLSEYATQPTTGVKYSMRFPYAVTLESVANDGIAATLATAQSSGSPFIADVKVNGASVFTTNKLLIDNGSLTSKGASTGANLTTTAIPALTPVTFEVIQAGTGGGGGNIVLKVRRT